MWRWGFRLSALLLLVPITVPSMVAAPAPQQETVAVTTPVDRPVISRLSGPTRYETAAAIAARAGELEPKEFRLVRGDRPLDAVATGIDATPVLYIPSHGPIPESVREAYASLRPATPRVVGSTRVLSTTRVRELIGSARFTRDAVDDPAQLSLERALPAANMSTGDDCSDLSIGRLAVVSTAAVAAAAAAAQADVVPLILLAPTGRTPQVDLDRRCNPYSFADPIQVIGGPGALSDARVTAFAKRATIPTARTHPRFAGADRFATTVILSRMAFPDGAGTVYLAGGHADPDAAAATGLTDGPVLLAPRCGLPRAVTAEIVRLRPDRIIALGSSALICDRTLRHARDATTRRPVVAATDVASGPGIRCILSTGDRVSCWGWDVAGGEVLRPRELPGLNGRYTSLAGAGNHGSSTVELCAVTRQRTVECRSSQPPSTLSTFRPVSSVTDVTDVALGAGTACATTVAGRVWCWGEGSVGQLGTGTRSRYGVEHPPALVPGVADAVGVAVGSRRVCALTRSGGVTCWGADDLTADSAGRFAVFPPRPVADLPTGIVEISLGRWNDPLTVRTGDGDVITLEGRVFADSRPTAEPWARGAVKLTPDGEGCAVHADGTQTCLDYDNRIVRRPAAGPGRVVAATDGCVVLDSGGVACRDHLTGDGTLRTRHTWTTPLGLQPA